MHGTGKIYYINEGHKHIIKANHSWIGKYTVRPMDPSWVQAASFWMAHAKPFDSHISATEYEYISHKVGPLLIVMHGVITPINGLKTWVTGVISPL